jgi:hypothetical protein
VAFLVLALLLLAPARARAQQWTCGSGACTTTGNVGVGTPGPTSPLEVDANSASDRARLGLKNTNATNKSAAVDLSAHSTSGAWELGTDLEANGSDDFYLFGGGAGAVRLFLNSSGNAGFGTTNPDVYGFGPAASYLTTQANAANQYAIVFAIGNGTGGAGFEGGNASIRRGVVSFEDGSNLIFYTNPTNSGSGVTERMRITSAGNVGIGTTNPQKALDVNGDINVSGNINAKYQDVAEWVPSTQKLSAGTVVVLDPDRANHVLASTTSYDTSVAGVISERPGIALGEGGEGKALVATTGRVKVKVDATRAPIKVGDLLVTSDKEGVAMRSEPVVVGGRKIHAPGTIIGKALEPLASGTGEILVLLSLQ